MGAPSACNPMPAVHGTHARTQSTRHKPAPATSSHRPRLHKLYTCPALHCPTSGVARLKGFPAKTPTPQTKTDHASFVKAYVILGTRTQKPLGPICSILMHVKSHPIPPPPPFLVELDCGQRDRPHRASDEHGKMKVLGRRQIEAVPHVMTKTHQRNNILSVPCPGPAAAPGAPPSFRPATRTT